MHYTLVRDSSKSNSHMSFLCNFTSSWPQLSPCKTFDPINALHSGLWFSTKFGGHKAFVRYLTSGWPGWPLHDLWPRQWVTLTLIRGSSYQVWWPYAFLSHLTSGWPWLTPAWPLTPAMHYTLVRGSSHQIWWDRALLSKLTLFDPSWHLHDLWLQQCIMLWPGILPTKCGGHKAFLSNLTPSLTQMTPAWPLTPAMHYVLVRGSPHQIW